MRSETPLEGELILYDTADGGTRVECRFQDETLAAPLHLFAHKVGEDGVVKWAGPLKPAALTFTEERGWIRPEDGRCTIPSRPDVQQGLIFSAPGTLIDHPTQTR